MSQVQSHPTIKQLLLRLAEAGLKTAYIKKYAFPGWWNAELATDQADFAQAVSFIHQRFGIPTEVLWNPDSVIELPDIGGICYKKPDSVKTSDITSAQSVAISAADLALEAMSETKINLPTKPTRIRDLILASGKPWVDLEALLDFIWAAGIPVIHIEEFPGRKMYGLAVKRNGRPVIVLSKNHKYQSLVMFDLAHELGHILCGHLDVNGVVVDVEIKFEDTDPCEQQATAAGLTILTGHTDPRYDFKGGLNSPTQWAKYRGALDRVCPGVIAQNYGFHHRDAQLANGVCKFSERSIKPLELIRKKMSENLEFASLSADDAEFLMRVSGGGKRRASSSRH